MKRLLLIATLLAFGGASGFAQGIVWSWVPNPDIGPGHSDPYGAPVVATPDFPIASIPVDLNGDGTVDFEFRERANAVRIVEVLQHGANEVLAFNVTPPDIGQIAVLLSRNDVVSSLAPVGSEWLREIIVGPYEIGAKVGEVRSYIAVRFYAADGIHYGALETAIWNNAGILYGYGYNPVPNAPFNLSEIPLVPEPSTWALLGVGIRVCLLKHRRK